LTRRATKSSRPGVRTGALLLGVLLAACANDRPRPIRPADDLRDPSSTRRVQAVSEVRRQRAAEHVPALIELLDDEDPAVRLVAGAALVDLTGRDTGYRPQADPAERRRQVEDWRRWWAATGAVPPPEVRAP
jgi:HEAT repeat protein